MHYHHSIDSYAIVDLHNRLKTIVCPLVAFSWLFSRQVGKLTLLNSTVAALLPSSYPLFRVKAFTVLLAYLVLLTGPWFEDRPMKNIMIGNKVHQSDLILEPDWIVIGGKQMGCFSLSSCFWCSDCDYNFNFHTRKMITRHIFVCLKLKFCS